MTKRKPMKPERGYVVVVRASGRVASVVLDRRDEARDLASAWGGQFFYVQPVDIIPAKGRKG